MDLRPYGAGLARIHARMMKLITAIVRPECLDGLVTTLVELGVHGLTVTDVKGFGRQYGQLTLAREAAGVERGVGFGRRQGALLPKVRLDLVVEDFEVDDIVQMILKTSETGTIGDGKIWIGPLDGVVRVRTGETGSDAI